MTLVDTSIWIDHLRRSDADLIALLLDLLPRLRLRVQARCFFSSSNLL
jgi:predicted nucleic acid-binding protein